MEQVQVDKKYLHVKEMEELSDILIEFKQRLDLSFITYGCLIKDEKIVRLERKANNKIKSINEKYGLNLPPLQYEFKDQWKE